MRVFQGLQIKIIGTQSHQSLLKTKDLAVKLTCEQLTHTHPLLQRSLTQEFKWF